MIYVQFKNKVVAKIDSDKELSKAEIFAIIADELWQIIDNETQTFSFIDIDYAKFMFNSIANNGLNDSTPLECWIDLK